ncbi:phosphotransferase family protein [Pseudalkalibacillus berkeleyi]|uniref:Phosphotransferase n=1 Tax=Pseudalkalibacillus berkeleyi TaxID=1069813 RepID=A0ABS9GU48_9BACL|nr:phosphotransferase [Pseudalkalibacillus berkeleyi]MCF6136367.1 phosphotransferase [Pseudalkalibacillus berkeleyi]
MYLEQYLNCIHSFYPSLEIQSVQWNHYGQNNDILFLNHQWVFRFPKHDEAAHTLQTECEQLGYIYPHISLPIPVPVFQNTDTNILGQSFVGYPLIPGTPLYPETVQSLTPSSKESLAKDLATFLHELHSIPTSNAPGKVISGHSSSQFWSTMYENISQSLFTYIRVEKQSEIKQHFEQYLNDQSNFTFTPKLIHGDFGMSNILFDEKEKQLSGIVDFGSSHIGDPAIDFAGLLKKYGKSFVDLMAPFYPGLESMIPRAQFYSGTFALQEALHGYRTENIESLENGLKEYV